MLFSPAEATSKREDTKIRQKLGASLPAKAHDIHTSLSSRRQQHTGHKHLSATKVAELHDVAVWIQEQVLRLNVPVTHTPFVDVGQRSRYLIHVELGENGRNKPGGSAVTGKDAIQCAAEESKAKDASLHQLITS